MSSSPLHAKIHELRGYLTFLANHQNTNDFEKDTKEAKTAVLNLFTELSQHLGLDTYSVPDQDPGLKTMFSHDLGLTLPPND